MITQQQLEEIWDGYGYEDDESESAQEYEGPPLYLVEYECCGREARGGGCGAWYVRGIREQQEGDRLVRRASPDHERSFYKDTPEIYDKWPHADEEYAIHGIEVCYSCRQP